MVTTAGSMQQPHNRRFPRKLGIASALVVLALVVWQSGVLNRVPSDYVPDAIERHLDTGPYPASAMLAGAYLYQQQRPLSCEYASTTIAATIGGWNITEYDFDDAVPLNENPHYGYRGNIWGEWGNTTDYGIYTEPLHDVLASWGIPSEVIYAEGDANILKRELSSGHAVVVWLAMRGEVNSFHVQDEEGRSYQLTQYMHVMTAYGYDEDYVYLSDPGTAVWRTYGWDEFMSMWNVMDGMALSVMPKTISMETDTFLAPTRFT